MSTSKKERRPVTPAALRLRAHAVPAGTYVTEAAGAVMVHGSGVVTVAGPGPRRQLLLSGLRLRVLDEIAASLA